MSLFKLVPERIADVSGASLVFPSGFSFFEPYLHHFVREILETGGEAWVSRTSDGAVSGLFMYDYPEKTGTVFTRSKEVFDYFYESRPFGSLFAELKTERESDVYDIYTIDLESLPVVHRFSHEISMVEDEQSDEIGKFMVSTHQGINRRWVKVALKNGDKCFTVRLENEIAGLGWVSFVNGIGRLHSLYVRPQFRGMGMGEDILYARLMWLKSRRARSAFSEIYRDNLPSSRVATKGHMSVSGQIFQYFKKPTPQVGFALHA